MPTKTSPAPPRKPAASRSTRRSAKTPVPSPPTAKAPTSRARARPSRATRRATRSAGTCGSTSPPTSSPAHPAVTDFIPPTRNSSRAACRIVPPNTIESDLRRRRQPKATRSNGSSATRSPDGNKVFEWRFNTEIGQRRWKETGGNQRQPDEVRLPEHPRGDLPVARPGRNRTGRTLTAAEKGCLTRSRRCNDGNGPITEPRPASTAAKNVKYGLDVENTGNLDAEEHRSRDGLPTGIDMHADSKSRARLDLQRRTPAKARRSTHVWTGLVESPGQKGEDAHFLVLKEVPSRRTSPQATPSTTKPGVTHLQIADQHRWKIRIRPERKHRSRSGDGEHREANTGQIKDPATVSTEEVGLVKKRDHLGHPVWQRRRSRRRSARRSTTRSKPTIPANSQPTARRTSRRSDRHPARRW